MTGPEKKFWVPSVWNPACKGGHYGQQCDKRGINVIRGVYGSSWKLDGISMRGRRGVVKTQILVFYIR
jgi:hypothetical protein